MTIPAGYSQTHTTMLAHEWWVRDARTDTRLDSPGRWKLLDTTILRKWKIVSDTKQRYVIPLRKCFDLSGHCAYWRQTRQCTQNPSFMAEVCPLTCRICESDYREEEEDEVEEEEISSDKEEEDSETADEGNGSTAESDEQADSSNDEL